jgi:hypothetical protein
MAQGIPNYCSDTICNAPKNWGSCISPTPEFPSVTYHAFMVLRLIKFKCAIWNLLEQEAQSPKSTEMKNIYTHICRFKECKWAAQGVTQQNNERRLSKSKFSPIKPMKSRPSTENRRARPPRQSTPRQVPHALGHLHL